MHYCWRRFELIVLHIKTIYSFDYSGHLARIAGGLIIFTPSGTTSLFTTTGQTQSNATMRKLWYLPSKYCDRYFISRLMRLIRYFISVIVEWMCHRKDAENYRIFPLWSLYWTIQIVMKSNNRGKNWFEDLLNECSAIDGAHARKSFYIAQNMWTFTVITVEMAVNLSDNECFAYK